MKKGNIILIKTYSWFGKKIREITNGQYSHVGMFVSKNKIIEATLTGVKLTDISKFQKLQQSKKLEYNIYEMKTTGKQLNIIVEYLLNQVGREYDFLHLMSLLFVFTFKIKRNINLLDIKKAFTCAELLSKALDKAGLKFSETIHKECITPHDIAQSGLLKCIL